MRAPRLAALELRRFGRGRLPRAAMVAMLLLPLLYGGLYLWSFWDPYDRLDRIPVALVNDDRGARTGGDELRAGDALVERLRDSDTFDWRETGGADARAGVEDGRYQLSLTVPADFSERLASGAGEHPGAGTLKVRTNDANNYLVGQISRTVFSEVRAAASSRTARGFLDRMFVSFSSLHDRTEEAADGADELGDGIGEARRGAGDLAGGLDEAEDGSGRLKDGTEELHTGSGKLRKGSRQVAGGTQKLADKVHGATKDVRPFLRDHDGDLASAARAVARGSSALRERLDELPAAARKARTDSRRAADALSVIHETRCGSSPEVPPEVPRPTGSPASPTPTASPAPSTPPVPAEPTAPRVGDRTGCADLKKAVDAAERAATVAKKVDDVTKDRRELEDLGRDLDTLHTQANALAEAAPHLGDDLDQAVAKIDKLNAGAHRVSRGAAALDTGLSSARSGAASLDTGLGKLSTGADSLNGGMFRLSDGSGKLANGLHKGAEKIPDHDEKQRDARTGVMADPVDLTSSALHAAPNYGTGFAPYFVPLSLWVGAMVAYMLLQPLNRRALAAGAPAARVALAGWLPVAAIGAAQALVLLAVLRWGLGLRLAHGAATVGFLLLVTVCFTAVVQFLNARFGPAGRILVLALLMLQLTSAGGTYPVQTSPGFFQALHPFLPMTYVVDGLRHLVTGGPAGPVWQACGVLAAYTAGALALTTLAARGRQMWTVERLHPEISL
ncbi:YhgE/Pip family protein [Streptomyces phytohabitans]|uniref:YhgE/Pip family protein n=1 Tax=Streptomyces phytohabitans TaxID=1150371 RepID=UPI00345BCCC3